MVGISLGDPCGVGPEVTLKALALPKVRRALTPVVFGDEAWAKRFDDLRAVTALDAKDRRPGKPTTASGEAQFRYLEAAIEAGKRGELDAICTAPVSKEQVARAGIGFRGHTEVLAEAFGRDVLMLMAGPKLKVALATNHLALRDVPGALTMNRLVAKLELLSRTVEPLVGRKPRIAVCGLNPHAGDGGLLGREELDVIAPAVEAARVGGIDCHGPFSADGLFAQWPGDGYDVALAMFHDQGLVAAKSLDFARTVNVTLGLPIPRTSPDHGVAYAIAGKNKADATSMAEALLCAAKLALAPNVREPGALLERHRPTDAKERDDLAAMKRFARLLNSPFSRSQWPAHFTGSAVVVDAKGQRVCLVHHKKLQRWLQPGGHADLADASSLLQTALREAREETGLEVAAARRAPQPLDVDVHVIPARADEPEHQHLDVRFLLVAKNSEALSAQVEEADAARWFSWSQALALADEPALKRLLLKAKRAGQRGLSRG